MEFIKFRNVEKTYKNGVNAVYDMNLDIKKGEFVFVIGASGSGKSTLIKMLYREERPTNGEIYVGGINVAKVKNNKVYKLRRKIGIVFQDYKLLPKLTVYENVAFALEIYGLPTNEVKRKVLKALDLVGLKSKTNSYPNQLSGGQMQRVAIARALVNNPDIILADEPTGALDTQTSVQVMEILKKISKDKLVIMVTHNPELAEKYSTRIVRILDGTIMNDSNPYTSEKKEAEKSNEKRRTSMKFFTALNLSLNNLMTKKGRTILTSFAGSIGIIGIALILALSNGIQNYIDKVEEDTLSSYPITIEESTIDTSAMIEKMMDENNDEEDRPQDKIYSKNIMSEMISTLSNKMENNNLTELKHYLEQEDNDIAKNSNAIQYGYNLNLNLYKEDTSNGVVQVNPSTVMDSMGMGSMREAQENSPMAMVSSSFSTMNNDAWTEMLDNEELLHSQYDLIAGSWPKSYNEVVLIVNENNELNDYVLYTLGLKDQEELSKQWEKAKKGENVDKEEETTYSYDELLKLSFKLILNSDYYEKQGNLWIDQSEDDDFMKEKIANAENINVVGIIKQNEQSTATAMNGGIGYLKDLKEYVINKTNEADIVKEQKVNPETNVFTGLEFPKSGEKSEFNFNNLSNEQKMAISQMSTEEIAKVMDTYTKNQNASYENNLKTLGAIDLDKPSSILIYPKTFESKELIAKAIEDYNKKQRDDGKEENTITYTDLVGAMMSSITNIIDAVSYALIAFVSISLVVSSIMIGIITYISVLERTKEIGILRAIGASKKDISRVFNAETFIIGFISRMIGVGITLLLTLPINSIIYALSGVAIHATVSVTQATVLVLISLGLTILAGLIPAKMASQKDPVEALRSE